MVVEARTPGRTDLADTRCVHRQPRRLLRAAGHLVAEGLQLIAGEQLVNSDAAVAQCSEAGRAGLGAGEGSPPWAGGCPRLAGAGQAK